MMPEPLPLLDPAAISAAIDEPYLSRGRTYANQNAIFDPRRSGLMISARCHGSSAPYYRVSATLNPNGMVQAADCTCPIGYGCKHIAALLLTYQAHPERFRLVEDVTTRLEQLDKAALIEVIKRMLAAEPELEYLLELQVTATSAGPVDAELIRSRVAHAAHATGDDWNALEDFADNLRPLLELADQYLRRDNIAQAAQVFAVLPLAALEHYNEFEDESGALHEVVAECVQGLSECLAASDAPELRRFMLEALYKIKQWDLDFGGIDMGAEAEDVIAEQAMPAEVQIVAEWVAQALAAAVADPYGSWKREILGRWMTRLLQRSGQPLNPAAALQIARTSGQAEQAVQILLEAGQLTEALAEAQQAPEHRLPRVAEVLWEAGHQEQALKLVEQRMRQQMHYLIADWLDAKIEQAPNVAQSLRIALALFTQAPTLDRYKRLVRVAERVGQWNRLRIEALSAVQKPGREDLLAQIYLSEGDLDGAVEVAGAIATSRTPNLTTLTQVAEAVEAELPNDAAWLYNRIAELLIAQQNRTSYTQAASAIRRLRDLQQRNGWFAEADADIARFRTEYKRYRALQEELTRAGLP